MKNLFIASALFVGAVFALYGTTPVVDKKTYDADVLKFTLSEYKGIGAKLS